MTKEKILNTPEIVDFMIDKSVMAESKMKLHERLDELCKLAIKALDKEPCEMTAEEYRQRMIRAFHNADCDELIAICVLPIENEFEHLEWLLKSNYKKEPCDDCISRQAVLDKAVYIETEEGWSGMTVDVKDIEALPSVNPQEPVLDKIRAEIMSKDGLEEALEIIDKYKAESEDKNDES